MEREILFRGKVSGKRLNKGEWIEGNLVHQLDYYGKPCDKYFILNKYDTNDYEIGEPIQVIPATVGQFTGLTDKNKIPQKVFEGDIVEYILSCEKYCGQVCYGIYEQDGSGGEYCPTLCIGFYIKCLFWTPQDWQEEDDERIYSYNRTVSLLNVEELMVIGNIHETGIDNNSGF